MASESNARDGLPRENCFDFIRLVAAVSVVVAHGVRHLDAHFLWVVPAGANVLHEGTEGVRVFFVLSGMLVFMSAVRCLETGRPIRSFFANRFLRVAPAIYAYAFVATLALIVIGALTLSDVVSRTHLLWLFGNLILYPLYFPPEHRDIGVGVLNGSLWTIPVEVMYYLVVPLLALSWVKGQRKAVGWVLGVSVLAFTLILDQVQRANPGWFAEGGDEALWFKVYIAALPPWLYWFALGIFWYRFWPRAPKGVAWFIASVAAYVVLAFLAFDALAPLGAFREILYGVPLSYATVWFGFQGPRALRDLSKVGDLSYGVYVWHMVVINLMLYFGLQRAWPEPVRVPAAIAITLAVAWLSWWLVEKPSLARKPYSSRKAIEQTDKGVEPEP